LRVKLHSPAEVVVAKLSPKSLKIINPGVLEPTKIIVVVEKT
jgi:hypothetical protein